MSAALTAIGRPFARIPAARRKQIGIGLLLIAALLFPILHDNDADIDSMANAGAYATLALGLNIVVGMAGLLDLGYAAFFAIGAYGYGILSSFQLMPPWTEFWEPFAWLHLVARIPGDSGDVVHFTLSFWLAMPLCGALAAGHRHLGLWRNRADRRPQLVGLDQWRRGVERHRPGHDRVI